MIPAIGVLPPLLIFVMVRAIAPVAGILPNRGAMILAAPCAISSVLESWRSPITPSATVADSSDWISSQYGNGDSHRKQFPDSFPIQRRHNGIGQLRFDGEAVADCLDQSIPPKVFIR